MANTQKPDETKLRQAIKKSEYSFVYNPAEEVEEEEMVAIYFLSADEKQLINCTLITLVFEYQVQLLAESENLFFAEYPEWTDKDYQEMPEKLQDAYDEVLEDLQASGEIKVEEFLDEVEKSVLEVGLNVEKLDSATIQRFVEQFQEQTFRLDPNLYQFEIFETD